MGIIGKSVKMCHLVGIAIIFCLCLVNFPSCTFPPNIGIGVVAANDAVDTKTKGSGALTVVESNLNSASDPDVSDSGDDGDGIVSVEAEANDVENMEEQSLELFEPTSDWKPVKKGQKIPHGLHVRLNLQTGEREAKLMEEKEPKKRQMNEWYAGQDMGVINTEKQRFTRDEIKKALKDFKFDEKQSDSDKHEKQAKTRADEVKQKFRSYDELKDAMKEMKMSVKTEAEIVTELIARLKDTDFSVEDIKTILIDLEYYLHQLDNARLFCDLEGIQVVVKLLNHTQEEVRVQSLLLLGAALQSNAKVQVNAVEKGVMQQLLRLISVDASTQVKKKSLFALSTLLRQFPYAQSQFLESGGLSAVTTLFSKSQDEMIKIKIVTLLTDLVQEKDLNTAHSNTEDELQKERSRQYSQVEMRTALHKSGWCSRLSSLLHRNSGHDDVEKILSAMTVLKETCRSQFWSLRQTLQTLSTQYMDLANLETEHGETDTFFHHIHANIQTLLEDSRDFPREDL